jgi:hypothetical protein
VRQDQEANSAPPNSARWRLDLGVGAIQFRLAGEAFLGAEAIKSRALTVEWLAIPGKPARTGLMGATMRTPGPTPARLTGDQ